MVGGPSAEHGGTDAHGQAPHDFSTNSNACGPCPAAWAAVQSADAGHYPDPAYTALRQALAQFHGVAAWRVLVAGSASEFIHRITQWAQLQGVRHVELPLHSYGDYAQAALARHMTVQCRGIAATGHVPTTQALPLQWSCEPSSPCGLADAALPAWLAQSDASALLRTADCAYAPLRLDLQGDDWLAQSRQRQAHCWQLFSPNKALGMTGVRAAYAIAPLPLAAPVSAVEQAIGQLDALAPSWPVGSHGVAMLHAWAAPATQQWLCECRPVLRRWKAQQISLCEERGWPVWPGSMANYFVCQPGVPDLARLLQTLRGKGIKLRDCASFGLPGRVRLGVLAPASQAALRESLPKP